MPMQREDEARYLRRLFINNWQTTEGYTLDTDLPIHTGEPDDTSGDPQIVIQNITEVPRGASGHDAFQGDGDGFVRRADGTADIRCIGGTDQDVSVHPRYLSRQFAGEIARICNEKWAGINDANTGDIEYRNLAAGVFQGPTSDPEEAGRWSAVQEVRYTYATP